MIRNTELFSHVDIGWDDSHFIQDYFWSCNRQSASLVSQSVGNKLPKRTFCRKSFNISVSRGNICLVFGTFGALSFLVTPALRFAFLPYYQRFTVISCIGWIEMQMEVILLPGKENIPRKLILRSSTIGFSMELNLSSNCQKDIAKTLDLL